MVKRKAPANSPVGDRGQIPIIVGSGMSFSAPRTGTRCEPRSRRPRNTSLTGRGNGPLEGLFQRRSSAAQGGYNASKCMDARLAWGLVVLCPGLRRRHAPPTDAQPTAGVWLPGRQGDAGQAGICRRLRRRLSAGASGGAADAGLLHRRMVPFLSPDGGRGLQRRPGDAALPAIHLHPGSTPTGSRTFAKSSAFPVTPQSSFSPPRGCR